jgi:hypothetical protein
MFQGLMAAIMVTVFSGATPCSLVEVTDVSEVVAATIHIAMVVDTASTSETSVNYQTTRRSIPDDV